MIIVLICQSIFVVKSLRATSHYASLYPSVIGESNNIVGFKVSHAGCEREH